MRIKPTICAAVIAAGLLAASVRADDKVPATKPATTQQAAVNAKCPITGEDVDSKVTTTTYDGKTYAFCRADCIATFKKDPAKYAPKAK